jgi:preprotein translocase subunit SecA
VADRRLGERPYPVQLMGALALHRGWLAEMATGEGKTLTAGVASVLTAWTGVPFHLVTVNDYLAERDAKWMEPLFAACDLSVGYVTGAMAPVDRRTNYRRDITYTTSKEITADFLRDRLRLGQYTDVVRWRVHQRFRLNGSLPDGVVMRGLHSAIIDEADSVLIDEAVTPLIISGLSDEAVLKDIHSRAAAVAGGLVQGTDYTVNLRYREVELLPPGRRQVRTAAEQWEDRWRSPANAGELVEQALTAQLFFIRDKHYVVHENKVVIVDEYTGRLMPNRKWRHGLHQAIEAKEGVALTAADTTLARMSFQRFYRLFRHLGGMSGTAWEVSGELWHINHLPVVRIPTNRPNRRDQWPDRYFVTAEQKWAAVVEEIQRLHTVGRPVLVGTRSVAASEQLAAQLSGQKIPFALLNALQDSEEARIIAEAGHPGRVTIATNMAGRGTDIRLEGGVAESGGLHVIATERHDSPRVDRQLFGRAGRQGDPGSAQAFVSMDDELLVRHTPTVLRRVVRTALTRGFPGAEKMAEKAVKIAQSTAEHMARRARANVLRMDTWLDEAVGFSGRRIG